MDLIYKINSVWLYDNQIYHSYLFLHDDSNTFNYCFSRTINKNPDNILSALANYNNVLVVKANEFITLSPVEGLNARDNYKPYDIYWNETKSGINLHQFEMAAVWNKGQTTYIDYRIHEYKNERQKEIRNLKINSIIS